MTSRSGSRDAISRMISRSRGGMSTSTIRIRSKRLPSERPGASFAAMRCRVNGSLGASSAQSWIRIRDASDLDLVETAAHAGDRGDLGAVLHLKLLEDVVYVVLDRRDLDPERLGDFLVREPTTE